LLVESSDETDDNDDDEPNSSDISYEDSNSESSQVGRLGKFDENAATWNEDSTSDESSEVGRLGKFDENSATWNEDFRGCSIARMTAPNTNTVCGFIKMEGNTIRPFEEVQSSEPMVSTLLFCLLTSDNYSQICFNFRSCG